MPFQADRFAAAKFQPRTSRVKLEALAAWFDEGEEPEFEVRGLSASELHQAIEAGKRQMSVEAIVQAIANGGDQAQAIRRALGLSGDTPGEIAKRLELLVIGCVSPKLDLPVAVKLAETFPIEFLMLTNEISELTGKGSDVVKPPAASEKTPASSAA